MMIPSSTTTLLSLIALLTSLTATSSTELECPSSLTASPNDALAHYFFNVPLRNELGDSSNPSDALVLHGQIIGNKNCAPVANAMVEVWYAGTPNAIGNSYLMDYRGRMITNDCGQYSFDQTFPVGESPYVHMIVTALDTSVILATKVYLGNSTVEGVDPSLVATVTNEPDGSRSALFNVYMDTAGTGQVCEESEETTIDDTPQPTLPPIHTTAPPTTAPPQSTTAPQTPAPITPAPQSTVPAPITPAPQTTASQTTVPEAQELIDQTPPPIPANVITGNNDCSMASTALPITAMGGAQPLDVVPITVKGTTDNGQPFAAPACFGVTSSSPSVWYKLVGTGGRMIATTCHAGTTLDTKLSIYQGTSCSSLTCVTANDDDSKCGTNSLASTTSEWDSIDGATYYIQVHGFATKTGPYELSVESHHRNDQCDQATPLAIGETFVGSTLNAAIPFEDNIARCQNDGGVVGSNPGLWYSIIGTGTTLEVSTCSDQTTIANNLYLFQETCSDSEDFRYEGDDDWDPALRGRRGLQGHHNHNGVDIHPDPLDFLEHCIAGVENSSPSACNTLQWNSVAGMQYYVLATSTIYEGDIAITLREV